MTLHVRFGVDRLCDDVSVLGGARRVGLVTNDAARLAANVPVHSRVALIEAGVPIVRLFGPEHGLSARADDGAAVRDGVDALTQLPVVSLYGERMRPTPESLTDLDVVLFDIPDVGTRCYTYTWTLYHLMAACEDASVPLMVLDRPNPLGGELGLAEGPVLELAHRSFIGEDRIPLRHQLTLGELARLWHRERFPRANLQVIPCSGWSRAMRWDATALPWVPTSPAMPTFASAQLYPGTCLFEATNLSVGRGTDAPFRQIGAPWLDATMVLRALANDAPSGAEFHKVAFTPSIAPYAGERCEGIAISVCDAGVLRPVALGLKLLGVVMAAHRDRFAWAQYPTAANPSGGGHFERLTGRGDIRRELDTRSVPLDDAMLDQWTGTDDWNARVQHVLCYR